MIIFGGDYRGWGFDPPPKPKARLHVEWGNNTGMLAYVSLDLFDLRDAEQKIPHMMLSMEDVIALAAKRGAMHG